MKIVAKRDGNCVDCGKEIKKGEKARWFPKIGILCLEPCTDAPKGPRPAVKDKAKKSQEIPAPAEGYEPCKETAKRVRQALKIKFPDTKFSVRSENFSMGSAVRVRWTDGPLEKEVSEVIRIYETIHRDQATGEILDGGNRYITTTRVISDELMEKAKAEAEKTGKEVWEVAHTLKG